MVQQLQSAQSVLRRGDLAYVFDCIKDARSCAVVGLSNVGKSWLLRALCRKEIQADFLGTQADEYIFVYIDCNLMLELSEQGFYEAVLRATRDVLSQDEADRTLLTQLDTHYQGVVESSPSFRVPLSFNEAIITLGEGTQRPIVFLFDEFDEPFDALDGRVFLNLRALKDRYGSGLCFVTATERELNQVRSEDAVSEFSELFAGRVRWLGMFDQDDAARLVEALATDQGADLAEDQLAFVLQQAGGHPGLLQAATQVLLRIEVGAPRGLRQQGFTLARDALDSDPNVRNECVKLWNQLEKSEQELLLRLVTLSSETAEKAPLHVLQRKGMLSIPLNNDKSSREPRVFGQLFERFTRRQRLIREGAVQGVLVDVDAGDAWVDGVKVDMLTDLEYRLLLLLYGRLGKICDKYQIVEAVWGEAYIDRVDDARIEKLVSRLRAKLERDPSNPRYLITVRGRGYKLAAS
jgi:DNA-binding response OmpR family regulator